MLEEKEKKPAAKTTDTPMFSVKANAGTDTDTGATNTPESIPRFHFIKELMEMIAVLISILKGEIGLVFKDYPDGTRTVFFGTKELVASDSSPVIEAPQKQKNWKDNPNVDVLQAMIDDKLLEPFNTADVRGLKLTKDFLSDKFAKYESSFGSMKAFALLGEEEGILFSVTGRPLNRTNLREYRETH